MATEAALTGGFADGSAKVPVIRTTDADEAARLLARGGMLLRHSHDMVLDLSRDITFRSSPPPHGLRMTPVDRQAAEIAAAAELATPPSHPDFPIWAELDRLAYWEELLRGEVTGPVSWDFSRLLVQLSGPLVGAVIVTLMEPSDWWSGGPWIPEIFVAPSWQERGLGRLLLRVAANACAAAGHPSLGLTVSDANPAKRFFERFGFRSFLTRWAIDVPDGL